MPGYVDGFVIVVPKKKLDVYKRMAAKGAAVWREHGALDYVETVGDDLAVKGMLPFTKLTGCKPSETVVFSWILYKSRAHRDRVNAKVMKDERMNEMMKQQAMPFDMKKMSYGGFKVIVD